MMTTQTMAPRAPGSKAKELAQQAVKIGRLKPHKGIELSAVENALAKTFTRIEPGTPHARLITSAIRTRPADCTAEQRVVRWLLCDGQIPSEPAVADRMRSEEAHAQRMTRIAVMASQLETDYSAKIMDAISALSAERGYSPTWREVFARAELPRLPGKQRGLICAELMGSLRKRGLIEFTRKPRSLRVADTLPSG